MTADCLQKTERGGSDERSGEVDLLRELRDGGDFVGFGLRGDLAPSRDPRQALPRAISNRRMQSREGTPLGGARCRASQEARCLARRWRAVGPSHPQMTPQTAVTARSISKCLRLRAWRGSGRKAIRSRNRSGRHRRDRPWEASWDRSVPASHPRTPERGEATLMTKPRISNKAASRQTAQITY